MIAAALVYLAGVALVLAFVAWRDPCWFVCDGALLAFGWPVFVPLGAVCALVFAILRRPAAWRWGLATVCWCVPCCAFAIYALLRPGLSPWLVLLQALSASVHIALVAASIGRMRECGGVA